MYEKFTPLTFSLKVIKTEGYPLSHKTTKNTFGSVLYIRASTGIKMMFLFSIHLYNFF